LTKKGLVAGYFSKFYYFILFSVTKIKKDIRVLGTPKGFPNTLKGVVPTGTTPFSYEIVE
ncbi:hypothetical protein, partial [Bacillus paranthracis]